MGAGISRDFTRLVPCLCVAAAPIVLRAGQPCMLSISIDSGQGASLRIHVCTDEVALQEEGEPAKEMTARRPAKHAADT